MKISPKQYQRMKDDLSAEYQQKLNALDIMWKQFGDKSSNGKHKESTGPRGELISQVLRIAQSFGKNFTIKDVEPEIKKIIPAARTTSIATALKRLCKDELMEVERGSGRWKPTTFAIRKKT